MLTDRTALANALMFDHAYKILNERWTIGINTNNLADMGLAIPAAVNCAFSCELFLKSMLPIGTRGHKLYNELFNKLDNISKDAIIDGTLKLIQLKENNYTIDNFYNDLIASENSFDTWRYFHEPKETKPNFNNRFMSCFQKAVKSLAIFYDKQESMQ